MHPEVAMKNNIVSSVQNFVRALDECNFEEAGRYLSPQCRYSINQTELTGPEEILGSYAQSAKRAEETLERIVYESDVEQKSAQTFDVLYTDRIFHGGLEHAFRSHQLLFVNDSGEIEKIVHQEIPGEREALKEFLERCGVQLS
jgi:hypothetical protein